MSLLLKSSLRASTRFTSSSSRVLLRSNSSSISLNPNSPTGGQGKGKTTGLLHATGVLALLLGVTTLTVRFSERNGINQNRLNLLAASPQSSSSSTSSSSSSSPSSTTPPSTDPSSSTSSLSPPPPSEDSEDHSQSAAYNPETGEINWDCPCLGGMADGPCGPEFKLAFSCFVYSEQEPKGVDCVEGFRGMQECFRKYPEIYGNDVDNEESEEELIEIAEAILRTPDEEFLIN